MKTWPLLMVLVMTLVGTTCFVQAETDDDDEYEEVVVKRKKKKGTATTKTETTVTPTAAVVVPTVVAVPVVTSVATTTTTVETKDEEPPPPPEPPTADSAEPRRLVRYFCKAWKDKDYERLWWAMSEKYRKGVSLKKFRKLFEGDLEMNGGLLDENIMEAGKTRDGNEGVKVELIFRFPKAKHRIVQAVAERQPGGAFRLVESPIIPLDLDDL